MDFTALQADIDHLTLEQRRVRIRELLDLRSIAEAKHSRLPDEDLAMLNLLLAAADLPETVQSDEVQAARQLIRDQLSRLNGDPAAYRDLTWGPPTVRLP